MIYDLLHRKKGRKDKVPMSERNFFLMADCFCKKTHVKRKAINDERRNARRNA